MPGYIRRQRPSSNRRGALSVGVALPNTQTGKSDKEQSQVDQDTCSQSCACRRFYAAIRAANNFSRGLIARSTPRFESA
jgi:hypothetical protein